jgi:hypothetical protein
MKVAAASKTIPVTNAAMKEYSKISVRALAILLSPCGFHLHAPLILGHSNSVAKK